MSSRTTQLWCWYMCLNFNQMDCFAYRRSCSLQAGQSTRHGAVLEAGVVSV